MKKSELLHSELSAAIALMGHTDTLCIGDCGLPVPPEVARIDLALKKGVPGFMETLDTVLTELCVEKVIFASEARDKNPELYRTLREKFASIEIEEVPHEELKARSQSCVAVVRTGEYKAYANIILQSGVTF